MVAPPWFLIVQASFSKETVQPALVIRLIDTMVTHVWGMQGISEQYFGGGLSIWDFYLQVPHADRIESLLVSGCDCVQWD